MTTFKFSGLFALSLLLFSTLSAQQNQQGTGALFDAESYSQTQLADFDDLGFGDQIPSAYSLEQYAPRAKSQNPYNSCVGWASTYAALTIAWAKKFGLRDKDLITASAFCPYYTINSLKGGESSTCMDGTYNYKALTFFRNNGAKRFYLPEYACGSHVEENINVNAKTFRIKSFKRLFDFPANFDGTVKGLFATHLDKSSGIKKAIAAGHPVTMSMQLPYSFFPLFNADSWTVYQREIDSINTYGYVQVAGHAMCIVGYDDYKNDGSFKVLNSWGESFGRDGYIWIRYKDFDRFGTEAFYFELYNDATSLAGCVFGDCENGYGRYRFVSGSTYEGEFENGVYKGIGIYQWPNGTTYAGEWKNGLRDGTGKTINANGLAITQTWSEGQVSGYASEWTKEAEAGCADGDCNSGKGTFNYLDGTYTGKFLSGMRHGYGKFTINNGVVVEGIWSFDKMNSFGKLTFPDGFYYVGEFQDGQQHGNGIEYGIEGFITGKWEYGKFMGLSKPETSMSPSGKAPKTELNTRAALGCATGNCEEGIGTYYYEGGGKYEGDFKAGARNGYGVYSWADGGKYEGLWRQNSQDGIAKFTFSGGGYFIGEYRKGVQDGYGIEVMNGYVTAGVWEMGTYNADKSILGFGEDQDPPEIKKINLPQDSQTKFKWVQGVNLMEVESIK